MIGIVYTAAYLLLRQIQIDAPKIKHVAPRIREATAHLPESERQAKADALWHDKKFVDAALDDAYKEKNWPLAIFFYIFWGCIIGLLCYWAFWPLIERWWRWYICNGCSF
jgi:hypothetical protein